VKRSEVVYIQGRGSSDYVATSYRLDGPASFPGSIFILFSSVFSAVPSVFSVSALFCNIHVLVLYLCICTVLYCGCSCTCTVKIRAMYSAVFVRRRCCFLVECMVSINTSTGHKPNCS
jgi:hypothetical protein